MNRIETARNIIDEWLTNNPKYDTVSKRVIEHPEKRETMTFSIVFSDHEKSVKYTATGFENDKMECCLMFEAVMFTGLNEDIDESHFVKNNELEIKNFGKSGEALIKLTRWYREDLELDMDEIVNIIVGNGINKLVY